MVTTQLYQGHKGHFSIHSLYIFIWKFSFTLMAFCIHSSLHCYLPLQVAWGTAVDSRAPVGSKCVIDSSPSPGSCLNPSLINILLQSSLSPIMPDYAWSNINEGTAPPRKITFLCGLAWRALLSLTLAYTWQHRWKMINSPIFALRCFCRVCCHAVFCKV